MPDQKCYSWQAIDTLFAAAVGTVVPAAAIEVRRRGEIIYTNAFGLVNPGAPGNAPPDEPAQPTTLQTRFDLASITKLFVVTTFMTFVEQDQVALDTPVHLILAEFSGRRPIAAQPDPLHIDQWMQIVPPAGDRVDAGKVTFRNLLVHNAGLPAWLPLFKAKTVEDMHGIALNTGFAYPTGTHVVYSDIGLILVGLALEQLGGKQLDELVYERVCAPLGLQSVHYSPVPCEGVAPTNGVYIPERLCGRVHDDNARGLGGVAGHAGLFADVHDLAELGETYRRGGAPLLRADTVAVMTGLQATEGAVRRGIGFALWSPDPEASSNPFSAQTYGHTGFTGTSLWVDPARELVVALLTNRVYYGSADAQAIADFRVELGRVICAVTNMRFSLST